MGEGCEGKERERRLQRWAELTRTKASLMSSARGRAASQTHAATLPTTIPPETVARVLALPQPSPADGHRRPLRLARPLRRRLSSRRRLPRRRRLPVGPRPTGRHVVAGRWRSQPGRPCAQPRPSRADDSGPRDQPGRAARRRRARAGRRRGPAGPDDAQLDDGGGVRRWRRHVARRWASELQQHIAYRHGCGRGRRRQVRPPLLHLRARLSLGGTLSAHSEADHR